MSQVESHGGCSRRAAEIGLVVGISGGVLVFIVPGGLWSDIPGWTLLVIGAFAEVLFTGAYLIARTRAGG